MNREGISYWIHGRDIPCYPASHGCIGLYDERMQLDYYGAPAHPALEDAKTLYDLMLGDVPGPGTMLCLRNGPRVVIRGIVPVS